VRAVGRRWIWRSGVRRWRPGSAAGFHRGIQGEGIGYRASGTGASYPLGTRGGPWSNEKARKTSLGVRNHPKKSPKTFKTNQHYPWKTPKKLVIPKKNLPESPKTAHNTKRNPGVPPPGNAPLVACFHRGIQGKGIGYRVRGIGCGV